MINRRAARCTARPFLCVCGWEADARFHYAPTPAAGGRLLIQIQSVQAGPFDRGGFPAARGFENFRQAFINCRDEGRHSFGLLPRQLAEAFRRPGQYRDTHQVARRNRLDRAGERRANRIERQELAITCGATPAGAYFERVSARRRPDPPARYRAANSAGSPILQVAAAHVGGPFFAMTGFGRSDLMPRRDARVLAVPSGIACCAATSR